MQINGTALRKLRLKKNLSQNDVSQETGIGRSTLNRIESGKIKNPLWMSVMELVDFYKVRIEDITLREKP